MSNYLTNQIDPVDAGDVSDPQSCAEYAVDIHNLLKDTESIFAAKPGFMEKQEDIN